MSQAKGATSMRRLVGLFNTSISSATNPTATSAAALNSSKSKVDPRKLKKLADRFKKSSESRKFRSYSKKAYSGKAGMSEHAHKLFDEMPEINCQRTVNSLNARLSAYLHSEKFDNVGKLLEELPEKIRIEPDLISYNTVIKAYCEMGSMDSAVSMIDTLEKKGLEPVIRTFNTLLDGLFSRGRIAAGEEIWELMEKKNVVPDTRTYNTKLRGLGHERKISEAVELWDEMKSKGVEPDIHSYNALITGYCNAGNLEQVLKWYGELKKSVLPDLVTYITVLSFFSKKNEFEMATEICKEAIDRRIKSGTALVDKLVKESRIEEAIQFVESGLSRSALRLKFPRP
ncbi:putative 3S-linalool/(E)-nerolidol /(E,E)-geranyl linalool synthase [Hibiscus syriacus]|uniref:3S-linalool/(E)-nerolidol /(E,E)-geranyl linalool synthase n=1 Tax=Hibiscus syriacus TaxID=106335 RepID=A0A6A3CNI2_HIBSY|nr:putative 3S-linalool/(E)-nerolidol /(E,E)-geranyl linalool synthase [Hibiscus syriacus]